MYASLIVSCSIVARFLTMRILFVPSSMRKDEMRKITKIYSFVIFFVKTLIFHVNSLDTYEGTLNRTNSVNPALDMKDSLGRDEAAIGDTSRSDRLDFAVDKPIMKSRDASAIEAPRRIHSPDPANTANPADELLDSLGRPDLPIEVSSRINNTRPVIEEPRKIGNANLVIVEPAPLRRLDSNSPSKFGFDKLDSAQFNVFQNYLRIPWQPLPSSAFIYSEDGRYHSDEQKLTTYQQVSATYRMATITPPYYPRNFGTQFDSYNYNSQFYDLIRKMPLERQLENLRIYNSSKLYSTFGPPSSQSFPLTRCFSKFQNCLLVNVASLERLSYVSVEQCMRRCLNYVTDIGVYCAGILYNYYTQSCDLHKTIGTSLPGRRVLMYGFDFYENCGSCNEKFTSAAPATIETTLRTSISPSTTLSLATKTTTVPLDNDETGSTQVTLTTTIDLNENSARCLSSAVPIFLRTSNVQRKNETGIISQIITDENNCGKLCIETNTCSSYSYDSFSNNCTLFSTVIEIDEKTALSKDSSVRYIYSEVSCLSAEAAEKCPLSLIERLPQRFFIGVSPSVQMVTSETQCVELCLNSLQLYKFKCVSVTYFPRENGLNCLMSDQSRKILPDFLQIENQTQVYYYGLDDCFTTDSLKSTDENNQEPSFVLEDVGEEEKSDTIMFASQLNAEISLSKQSGQILKIGEWIHWSSCNQQSNGVRKRYKYCKADSLELCPVEYKNCNSESNDETDHYHTLYERLSKNFHRDNPIIKRLRKLRIKSIACWTKSPICNSYTDYN